MNAYTTLTDVKALLGIATATTGDDALLEQLCIRASRNFDRWTRRRFYPTLETRYYAHADSRVLKVEGDLLAVTTLTTANDTVTLTSGEYYLMCGDSYNQTPYDRIVLRSDEGKLFYISGSAEKCEKVIGTWGYHSDWSNAWQDSNDTIQDATGITAAATSITVTDADGADIYGDTPRFKVGQLLKIESEYAHLTAIDTGTNVLTVRRGINGTAAATHAKSTTIYAFVPEPEIVMAMIRYVQYLYRQKDADSFDVVGQSSIGTIVVPSGVPSDVKAAIDTYTRRRRSIL